MILTPSQIHFLTLHREHFVESWQQLFQGAMVRARTDRGHSVTLRADEMNRLYLEGLIDVRHGAVELTAMGRSVAA